MSSRRRLIALVVAIMATASACGRDLLDDANDGPGLRRAIAGFAAPGMPVDSARARLQTEGFICEPEAAAGIRGLRCEHEAVRDDAVWRWAVTLHANADQIERVGTFVSRNRAARRVLP